MNSLQARFSSFKAKASQRLLAPEVGRVSEPVQVLYDALEESWEEFKRCFEEPRAAPDLEILQKFFWWYTVNAKGRIGEKPTISTLLYNVGRFGCMYKRRFKFQIPEDTLDDVRVFVRNELRIEFDLQDTCYDKEFASFEDVKIMIRYIVLYDDHIYHDARYRAQLVLIFLLVAEDGSRLGVICRSDSYRKANASLLYGEVKLYIKPFKSGDNAPAFKLQIDFNNRKNERGDPTRFLRQTYFSCNDLPHCIVLWFLVLAFLDNAFEEYSIPSELFNLRNQGTADLPIRIKREKMAIPIFRRTEGVGRRKLSQTLSWSTNSVNTESQRIVRGAGYRQRFTHYAIRRAVFNKVADDETIDAGRKKQLMGHHGPSDKIFTKYYQSSINTVDTGAIFRGLQQRPEKSQVLNMYSSRDPTAPRFLSNEQRTELYNTDKEIKFLIQCREELKDELRELGDHPDHNCSKTTIQAAILGIRSGLNRRKHYLKSHKLKDIRAQHFENNPICGKAVPDIPILRPVLAEILYPESGTLGTPVGVLEQLIKHCTFQENCSDTAARKIRQQKDSKTALTEDQDRLVQEFVEI